MTNYINDIQKRELKLKEIAKINYKIIKGVCNEVSLSKNLRECEKEGKLENLTRTMELIGKEYIIQKFSEPIKEDSEGRKDRFELYRVLRDEGQSHEKIKAKAEEYGFFDLKELGQHGRIYGKYNKKKE